MRMKGDGEQFSSVAGHRSAGGLYPRTMQKIGYSISSTESGILLQAGSVEILFTCGNMLAESRPHSVCLTVQQVSLMKSSLSDGVSDDSVLLLAALIEQLNQATVSRFSEIASTSQSDRRSRRMRQCARLTWCGEAAAKRLRSSDIIGEAELMCR